MNGMFCHHLKPWINRIRMMSEMFCVQRDRLYPADGHAAAPSLRAGKMHRIFIGTAFFFVMTVRKLPLYHIIIIRKLFEITKKPRPTGISRGKGPCFQAFFNLHHGSGVVVIAEAIARSLESLNRRHLSWFIYEHLDADAELTKHPVDAFSAGLVDDSSVFEWAVTFMGPPDTF